MINRAGLLQTKLSRHTPDTLPQHQTSVHISTTGPFTEKQSSPG
jgi:hypothetical protein